MSGSVLAFPLDLPVSAYFQLSLTQTTEAVTAPCALPTPRGTPSLFGGCTRGQSTPDRLSAVLLCHGLRADSQCPVGAGYLPFGPKLRGGPNTKEKGSAGAVSDDWCRLHTCCWQNGPYSEAEVQRHYQPSCCGNGAYGTKRKRGKLGRPPGGRAAPPPRPWGGLDACGKLAQRPDSRQDGIRSNSGLRQRLCSVLIRPCAALA